MRIELQGLAEAEAKLTKIQETVTGPPVDGALKAGATIMRNEARRLAPVKTGALRASISVDASKGEATISVGVPYAVFVEYGSSRRAPHPFMRPAVFGHREDVAKELEDLLSKQGD